MTTLTGMFSPSVEVWLNGKVGMVSDLENSFTPPRYIGSTTLVSTEPRVLAASNTYVQSEVINYTDTMYHLYSPYDDIYNRFYVVPDQLSFGAITGDTVKKVMIWNAHITPEQVGSFSESGYTEGDNVKNNFFDVSFPMNFYGLEVKRFEVAAAFKGNPEFSIGYTFTTTTNTVTVEVKGYRSVLFALSPDRIFKHAYKFESRITESFNSEQRATLGGKMLESFRYKARTTEYLRAYYRQLLNSGTLIRFSVPVWEDYVNVQSVLSGTKHIDVGLSNLISDLSFYVGHSLVMWSDERDYEQAKIVGIDYDINRIYLENEIKSNRSDFFLMPLRAAVNDDALNMDYKGINSHHFTCDFKLVEQTEIPNIEGGLEFLEGKPVLAEPNYQGSGKENFGYERDEFKGVGSDISSRLNRGFSDEVKTYVWKCWSREELLKLKQFIFTIRGKWKSFWLPRFGREFKLAESTNINDSQFTLDIRGIDYNIKDFEGVALYLQTKSSRKYFGVINTVTNDDGIVSISCKNAIQFAVEPEDIFHLCIADLVRSTTDEFELEFDDINEISCKISARKVKE